MAQTPHCPKIPRDPAATDFITVAFQETGLGHLSAEASPVSAVCALLPACPSRRSCLPAADGPARMQSTTQQGRHAHLPPPQLQIRCKSSAFAASSRRYSSATIAVSAVRCAQLRATNPSPFATLDLQRLHAREQGTIHPAALQSDAHAGPLR